MNVDNDNHFIGEVIILRNITLFHELNDAKTNFLATLSYELKTPAAAIKINSELLSDQRVGLISLEQLELVSSIHEDANKLLKIISELVNISQPKLITDSNIS